MTFGEGEKVAQHGEGKKSATIFFDINFFHHVVQSQSRCADTDTTKCLSRRKQQD